MEMHPKHPWKPCYLTRSFKIEASEDQKEWWLVQPVKGKIRLQLGCASRPSLVQTSHLLSTLSMAGHPTKHFNKTTQQQPPLRAWNLTDPITLDSPNDLQRKWLPSLFEETGPSRCGQDPRLGFTPKLSNSKLSAIFINVMTLSPHHDAAS